MALPPRPRRPPETAFVAPPSPPLPRLEDESGAAEPSPAPPPPEAGSGPPTPTTLPAGDTPAPPAVGRLVLDPAAAELISRAISAAISVEIGRVQASLAPPPAPEPPGAKAPSEPPRSSIRVAAKKGTRWSAYALGALALAGQLIVWFGRPELAGPIAQALRLIAWLVGGHAPPADLAP